jgi:hypothetical protein
VRLLQRIDPRLDSLVHGEHDRLAYTIKRNLWSASLLVLTLFLPQRDRRNQLTRSDSHHPRRDTLVECADALLTEHVAGDRLESTERRLALESTGFLDSGLDGVDRGVREGTHGAGNEAEDHGLVGGEGIGRGEGGLEFVGELFELLEKGEQVEERLADRKEPRAREAMRG